MMEFDSNKLSRLLSAVAQASSAILEHYDPQGGSEEFTTKSDGSPLTAADQASHEILRAALTKHFPDIPVISEEDSAPTANVDRDGRYWLVDPLDGTKEFLAGNDQFTVNVGLIENHSPVFGIVAAPALERVWIGDVTAGKAECMGDDGSIELIETRHPQIDALTLLRSRSHVSDKDRALVADYTIETERALGSSLKFCLIAEGGADVCPRAGRTMEWDSAAGQAIVLAAGGRVMRADDQTQPLTYGKTDDANDCGFVIWGK